MAQDFETLANPSMIGMLYFVLFMILFLENGLLCRLFARRQPVDLVGVLIAKGAMGYPQTILLLTVAASTGCWVSYIQGRWLGIPAPCKTGSLISPHIIINAPITFSISTACRHY